MKQPLFSVERVFSVNSEQLIIQMADRLVEDGYRDAGYEYVSIDVSSVSGLQELVVFVLQSHRSLQPPPPLCGVTRKHWPPVCGSPLQTGSSDYLLTGPWTTPTDPLKDHPQNSIKKKNKDFTHTFFPLSVKLEISPTRVIYRRSSKWNLYFCFLYYFGGGP